MKIHLSSKLFLSKQPLIASQLTKNLLLYCWSTYRYSSSFYEKDQGRKYLYNMYQDISMLNVKPLHIHLGQNYWLCNPSQLPKLPPTFSLNCLGEIHGEFLAEKLMFSNQSLMLHLLMSWNLQYQEKATAEKQKKLITYNSRKGSCTVNASLFISREYIKLNITYLYSINILYSFRRLLNFLSFSTEDSSTKFWGTSSQRF